MQNSAEEGSSFLFERLNNAFFKANLLQLLTEAQQAAALAAAIRVLPHWRSKALSGSEKYKRWLTEVGLTAEDLALFDRSDAQATANPKVRAALRQMVGQMIMDPNPVRNQHGCLTHALLWLHT